jgi:hypothetical protein
MSAANTLTFASVQAGVGIMDRVAWILHRIEYYFSVACLNELQATTDTLDVALTVSNQLTSLSLRDPNIITMIDLVPLVHGAATSTELQQQPYIREFMELPNNGILIIPAPLYIGMVTAGFVSAYTCTARYFYTQIELGDADYLSLVQSRRLIS